LLGAEVGRDAPSVPEPRFLQFRHMRRSSSLRPIGPLGLVHGLVLLLSRCWRHRQISTLLTGQRCLFVWLFGSVSV
jgi:hypothetical protein